jgi:hypothetical protein
MRIHFIEDIYKTYCLEFAKVLAVILNSSSLSTFDLWLKMKSSNLHTTNALGWEHG